MFSNQNHGLSHFTQPLDCLGAETVKIIPYNHNMRSYQKVKVNIPVLIYQKMLLDHKHGLSHFNQPLDYLGPETVPFNP